MSERPRFVLCGLGKRATNMYLPLLFQQHAAAVELVGVVEPDHGRLAELSPMLPSDVMRGDRLLTVLDSTRPDWLIVASPDDQHGLQITTALSMDVNVISEKPMVTDRSGVAEVLTAVKASTADLFVAHNYRNLNLHREIQGVLSRGTIGEPFRYRLDYKLSPGHGRSYFQRWHRRMKVSGGLQITKSCHHFDLLNWLSRSAPRNVSAITARRFFFADPSSSVIDEMHIPDDADIDDTIDCLIEYENGSVASYSLTGCSPWEGYDLEIAGTDGVLSTRFVAKNPTGSVPADAEITIADYKGNKHVTSVSREHGRHGGADVRTIEALVSLVHGETYDAGVMALPTEAALAVLVGDAVTQSARTRTTVTIPAPQDLIKTTGAIK